MKARLIAAPLSLGLFGLLVGCEDQRDTAPRPHLSTVAGMTWHTVAPMTLPRTEVAATAAGQRIYVIGGFVADGATVATVEVLDTTTGRWTRGPDLPLAVNHAMAATVDGNVYVFGGWRTDKQASAAAFRLDGAAWRPIAEMPQPRAAGVSVVLPGSVYVAGGVARSGLAEEMMVYDVANDRWTTAPGPPTRREHLGGAASGGRVYTVGGRTGAGNLTAFEVYDPNSAQWATLPDLPTARGGLAGAATCTGHVVAVGGEIPATFAEAEAFDVRGGRWLALPDMPTARHGLGAVVVGTTLYTLAGGPQPGLHVTNAVEAIDLAGLGACTGP
jgi:non-specific serine/threonine protein kinase